MGGRARPPEAKGPVVEGRRPEGGGGAAPGGGASDGTGGTGGGTGGTGGTWGGTGATGDATRDAAEQQSRGWGQIIKRADPRGRGSLSTSESGTGDRTGCQSCAHQLQTEM